MWGQTLPQTCAEQRPVLWGLCCSVTPGTRRGPQGHPLGKQEHGQLASAAHSQNAQRQKAGGLRLGARGWDSFVLVPAATYVHLTTLLLQY